MERTTPQGFWEEISKGGGEGPILSCLRERRKAAVGGFRKKTKLKYTGNAINEVENEKEGG